MAAEFHRKTAALFEEFKKRELHFLNTEVNLNSTVSWKNIDSPLQEYLQKINKREQETEKNYKDLMRQMEELGKRTDQMTMKLEKLNALRNVALSSNISTWPTTEDTYDRPFQSYYTNTLFQTTPRILSSGAAGSNFPSRIQPDISVSNHSFLHSSSKPNYNSVTTQTEYIFCDNCNFPLILNSDMPVSNLNFSSKTSNRTISKESEQNLSHNFAGTQENVDFPRETVVTKTIIENRKSIPKSNYNFSDAQVNDHEDSMFMNERTSSGMAEVSLKEQELINRHLEKRMSKNYIDNTVTSELTNEPVQKRMSEGYSDNVVTDELTNMSVQKRMSENYIDNVDIEEPENVQFQKRMSESYIDNVDIEESANVPVQKRMSESYIDNAVTGDYVTHTEEKQYVEIQDSDLLSNDGNFEQTISKSDDESMQREFDFLESDKSPKKQSLHQVSANNQMIEGITYNERYETNQPEANYHTQSHTNQSLKVQEISGNGKKIEGASSKDSIYSTGLPTPSAHFENASIVSESDSLSEETPLTATAAYQALLGNVSVNKPKQKSAPISDSETEDEIENALANAVRRTSHIAFDAAVLDSKAEKRKESIPENKTEKNTKPIDSISSTRPQNKLSKNTRKVLGLDTSSGSEVELEVKSPANKIEEESDEFDFYD
ncbi:uncharacterized protein LOC129976112 isoform X2 [Argiope bruennichi]|uniref:uncharacterized protein LOC129976112 isoform X2 n=1 Tax=Argiope bruennichi TaxID=94029 RepID=UPI002494B81F|nr:uncharacterized protein LOC129976112 isoform X2 [Argiope bruennichi]